MLKGGGVRRKGFGVVFSWKLEVLAILKGKRYPPFKNGGGDENVYPVLRGGGAAKSFRHAIFLFCSPPPPCN